MSRDDLKHLLVRRSILSPAQIGDALHRTRGTGATWLEHLLEAGVLEEEGLADWVSRESKVPLCGMAQLASVPLDVVARLPAEVAVEHRLMPTALDDEGYLHVAMVDPTDALAAQEAEFFAGVRLMRQVAAASVVAWALHRYYGAASRLWPRAAQLVHAAS